MSSVLGIPDLGYLTFTAHSLLSSLLWPILSLRHHLSAPVKSRQTCLVFAQVFHINHRKGRCAVEEHMHLKLPKPQRLGLHRDVSVIGQLSWNELEPSKNSRPQGETEIISEQRANQIKTGLC